MYRGRISAALLVTVRRRRENGVLRFGSLRSGSCTPAVPWYSPADRRRPN